MSLLLTRESALLSRIQSVLPAHRRIAVPDTNTISGDAITGPRVYVSLRAWKPVESTLLWSVLLLEDDPRGHHVRLAGLSGDVQPRGILPSVSVLRDALNADPYRSAGGQYRRAPEGLLAWEELTEEPLSPGETITPETPVIPSSLHLPMIARQVQWIATIAATATPGAVSFAELTHAAVGDRLLLVADKVYDLGIVVAGEGEGTRELGNPLPVGLGEGNTLFRVTTHVSLETALLLRQDRDFSRERPLLRTLSGALRPTLIASPTIECRIEIPRVSRAEQQQWNTLLTDLESDPERLLLTGSGEALAFAPTRIVRDGVPTHEFARWIIEGEATTAITLAILAGGTA